MTVNTPGRGASTTKKKIRYYFMMDIDAQNVIAQK